MQVPFPHSSHKNESYIKEKVTHLTFSVFGSWKFKELKFFQKGVRT